jgi:hypothetical protein
LTSGMIQVFWKFVLHIFGCACAAKLGKAVVVGIARRTYEISERVGMNEYC